MSRPVQCSGVSDHVWVFTEFRLNENMKPKNQTNKLANTVVKFASAPKKRKKKMRSAYKFEKKKEESPFLR